MIYQLQTGKIIELSMEQYLEMTDDDIEYFIAFNVGELVNNPFFRSSFQNKPVIEQDEDITLNLTEMDSDDKLIDLDLDQTMLEE